MVTAMFPNECMIFVTRMVCNYCDNRTCNDSNLRVQQCNFNSCWWLHVCDPRNCSNCYWICDHQLQCFLMATCVCHHLIVAILNEHPSNLWAIIHVNICTNYQITVAVRRECQTSCYVGFNNNNCVEQITIQLAYCHIKFESAYWW